MGKCMQDLLGKCKNESKIISTKYFETEEIQVSLKLSALNDYIYFPN